MKSRFGLILLAAGCVSLAGCANWQNRAGQLNAPGNAAGLDLQTPPSSGPLLGAPGSSFGEPPPPMAPPSSDPFLTLPPEEMPPASNRLDLAKNESRPAAAPSKMYNLESSSKRKTTASSNSSSAAKKSSTLSRLAEKSDDTAVVAKADPAPEPPPEEKKVTRSATLERLSRDANRDSAATGDGPTPTSLPRPQGTEEAAVPAAAPSTAPADAPADEGTIDTTLLAQPVRKGADAGDAAKKESKGPQSSLIRSDNSFFNGSVKPVIYPVSNPAVEERVDLNRFS